MVVVVFVLCSLTILFCHIKTKNGVEFIISYAGFTFSVLNVMFYP